MDNNKNKQQKLFKTITLLIILLAIAILFVLLFTSSSQESDQKSFSEIIEGYKKAEYKTETLDLAFGYNNPEESGATSVDLKINKTNQNNKHLINVEVDMITIELDEISSYIDIFFEDENYFIKMSNLGEFLEYTEYSLPMNGLLGEELATYLVDKTDGEWFLLNEEEIKNLSDVLEPEYDFKSLKACLTEKSAKIDFLDYVSFSDKNTELIETTIDSDGLVDSLSSFYNCMGTKDKSIAEGLGIVLSGGSEKTFSTFNKNPEINYQDGIKSFIYSFSIFSTIENDEYNFAIETNHSFSTATFNPIKSPDYYILVSELIEDYYLNNPPIEIDE